MGQLWWIHLRYQYRLTGNVYGSFLCSLKKELQKAKGKRIKKMWNLKEVGVPWGDLYPTLVLLSRGK